MNVKSLALALALAPAAIGAASADETFYFTFNNSAFNDVGVTETGWVTIADTGLGVGAVRQNTIVNGSVTVSGTVYGPEDWVGGSVVDWSLFPLNLTTQLVGQNKSLFALSASWPLAEPQRAISICSRAHSETSSELRQHSLPSRSRYLATSSGWCRLPYPPPCPSLRAGR